MSFLLTNDLMDNCTSNCFGRMQNCIWWCTRQWKAFYSQDMKTCDVWFYENYFETNNHVIVWNLEAWFYENYFEMNNHDIVWNL